MDVPNLAALGKVAGIGGIALGVTALIVLRVMGRISTVPAAQRAPMLRFVAAGAFGLGALGIAAWLISQNHGASAQNGSVAAGGDIAGSTITIAPQTSH